MPEPGQRGPLLTPTETCGRCFMTPVGLLGPRQPQPVPASARPSFRTRVLGLLRVFPLQTRCPACHVFPDHSVFCSSAPVSEARLNVGHACPVRASHGHGHRHRRDVPASGAQFCVGWGVGSRRSRTFDEKRLRSSAWMPREHWKHCREAGGLVPRVPCAPVFLFKFIIICAPNTELELTTRDQESQAPLTEPARHRLVLCPEDAVGLTDPGRQTGRSRSVT